MRVPDALDRFLVRLPWSLHCSSGNGPAQGVFLSVAWMFDGLTLRLVNLVPTNRLIAAE